jgi:4-diphosphocytidyl-2-C-methyl-D-erythritol kinase
VRVRVPAKINLALKVGRPRPDGYHPLATVYHAVSLFDEINAEAAPPGFFDAVVRGEGAELVPIGPDNLAVRAARLLSERVAGARGVAMSIHKSIPVAGGLAGGSADAAAALLACAQLWDLDIGQDELLRLAAELGSDVPFALIGGTAVGSGRGEEVVAALARGTYHWVLAFGHQGLSTPQVYRRFDELHPDPAPPRIPDELMNALRAGDPARLGAALVNDLHRAAVDLQPTLQRTIDAGLEGGALGALVSGSGPTVAFLMSGESAAIDLEVALSLEPHCRAARRAVGPVGGAQLVLS